MSDGTRYLRFVNAASKELEQAEQSHGDFGNGPTVDYYLRRAEVWAELARAAAEYGNG